MKSFELYDFLKIYSVVNWSWLEEIILWDTCIEPLRSIEEDFFKLPNLRTLKIRSSRTDNDEDQVRL